LHAGKNLKKSYGSWAVVTGATDGIGLAMAKEFARKGLNVVLISRSMDKLKACSEEMHLKSPNVEVKVLDIDFGHFDESARGRVAALLKDLDVGVLVNNVGISYPYTKYFHELDDVSVEQLITLNVNSTTWMTRIVLPSMLAKKRGAIVNMASAAGVLNSPLLAQYGAAK
jgi:17beta-estradiol 17-dehydrogenase / very-long-chain 3-oxoacyl-CoA reductase